MIWSRSLPGAQGGSSTTAVALALAATLLLATSRRAAAATATGLKGPPPPPPGDPAMADPDAAAMRAKIEHRIKTMRAMFLTEALDLDEPTSKKLFAVLDKADEKRRALMAERETLVKALRKSAAAAPTDAEIDGLIDKLGKNRLAEVTLNLTINAEVKAFLAPAQRARLAFALPKFYAKLRKIVHEARKDMMEKAIDDDMF